MSATVRQQVVAAVAGEGPRPDQAAAAADDPAERATMAEMQRSLDRAMVAPTT